METANVSKLPSDKTLLARAKRDIRDLEKDISALRSELNAQRARANKAEMSAREWENRFDELLAAFKGPAPSPSSAGEKHGEG